MPSSTKRLAKIASFFIVIKKNSNYSLVFGHFLYIYLLAYK